MARESIGKKIKSIEGHNGDGGNREAVEKKIWFSS
jgi:hypothetical protein